MRPYSPAYAPFAWRGWFDFGCGALGDMACHILGAPNMALLLGAPTSVEVIKQEGKNPYTFPKKSVTRFEFPARHNMPAVKLYWYDAQTGPAFRPESVPETEPLSGGAGSFGAAGTIFTGGGAVRTQQPAGTGTNVGGPQATAQGRRAGARAGGGGGGAQNNGAVFIGEKGIITTDTY